ncbi:MAG: flippase [Thiobacillus sp.]
MSRRRLIENVLSLGALQAASYILPLLTLPYLARVLGPENLGKLAFAIAFSQIFVMLTDYGFNLSATREISLHRANPDKVAEIFASITVLRLAFMLLGFVLLLALTQLIPRFAADAPLYAACYLLVVGNVLFPQWLFQGLEQLRLVSLLQIVARVLVVIGIFIFVKSRDDLLAAALLQSSGAALAGLLTLPYIAKALKHTRLTWPTGAALMSRLREGWHVFISAAAINVYTTSNAFLLGLLSPALQVGYYHLAEKLVRAVQLMFGPVSQAVYPHISLLAQEDPARALLFNRKLMIGLGALGLVISAAVYFLSPLVVSLLFGPAYAPVVTVLKILAFLPFVVILSNILGIQTMLTFGMKRAYSRVYLITALFNLAIFIPLAWYFGAVGAASANLAVESFVTITMFILLHRRGKNPLTFRPALAATS